MGDEGGLRIERRGQQALNKRNRVESNVVRIGRMNEFPSLGPLL